MHGVGQPVISIDTKKKEPIGAVKNGGSDDRPEGCPVKVNMHDLIDRDLGKAIPYGVCDIAANAGCVSVGISNDTAQLSVNLIRMPFTLPFPPLRAPVLPSAAQVGTCPTG